MQLFWKDIALYSLIGGVMFCFSILAVLYINPLLFTADYPSDVIAAIESLNLRQPTTTEIIYGTLTLFAPLLFAAFMFNKRIIAKVGKKVQKFSLLYVHNFIFMFIVMLLDLIFIDWIMMNTLAAHPVVIAGTEGTAGYSDYTFHLVQHFGTVKAWFGIFFFPLFLTLLYYVVVWLSARYAAVKALRSQK